MSRKKAKNQTDHAMRRLEERSEIGSSKRSLEGFLKNASKSGLSLMDFESEPDLFDFILSKQRGKRVKVWKGFVVILCKTSDRAITAYKLPEEFREAYERCLALHQRRNKRRK